MVVHLAACVGQPKNIGLAEVPVGGDDDDIKHHGDPPQEGLQSGGIGSLKDVQKEMYHLQRAFGSVTPSLLQSQLLESTQRFMIA